VFPSDFAVRGKSNEHVLAFLAMLELPNTVRRIFWAFGQGAVTHGIISAFFYMTFVERTVTLRARGSVTILLLVGQTVQRIILAFPVVTMLSIFSAFLPVTMLVIFRVFVG
jgi:hypothetical protein